MERQTRYVYYIYNFWKRRCLNINQEWSCCQHQTGNHRCIYDCIYNHDYNKYMGEVDMLN